jgi:hypothetical protein
MKSEAEIRSLLERVNKLNRFCIERKEEKEDEQEQEETAEMLSNVDATIKALEWVLERQQFSRTNEKTGRVEIDYSADGFMSYLTVDHLEYETETYNWL